MDSHKFLNTYSDLQIFATSLKKKYSTNSIISFKNDWHNFVIFCQLHQLQPLPASIETVCLFIDKQAKDKKMASLKRALISISHVHHAFDLADPTKSIRTKAMLNKIKLDKKDDSKQTEAMSLEMLTDLDNQLCQSKELKDIRDLVIWYLMFELLLKRSELRDLKVEDIIFDDSDNCMVQLQQHYYPISQKTASLLNCWLMASQLSDSYLFRGLDRHQNVSDTHLNDSSIYRIFRRASELLNLNVQFSGLSARVGATTELSKSGYTICEIQAMGRWASPAMPNQYIGNTTLSEKQKAIFKNKPE